MSASMSGRSARASPGQRPAIWDNSPSDERARIRDRMQHAVVEHDVRRDVVRLRAFEAPIAEALCVCSPLALLRGRGLGHAELLQETRPLARPGQPQDALRTRHADVRAAGASPRSPPESRACFDGSSLLLQPRNEHGLELEALRASS